MKKILGIIILSLFCFNYALANQQQLIEKYLKDRKLEPVEGVWHDRGVVTVIFKDDQIYKSAFLGENNTLRCGEYNTISKLGENYFQYQRNEYEGEKYGKRTGCKKKKPIFTFSYFVNNNLLNFTGSVNVKGVKSWNGSMTRIWPEDIVAHNKKFRTKDDFEKERKELALIVNDVKKTCSVLGFDEESEKFADCTLKLYTQKIEEIVADKQIRNQQLIQSQQTNTTTSQSTGTNTTVIYDPVRDNQRMIDQGMKMLGGKCTLGVDC